VIYPTWCTHSPITPEVVASIQQIAAKGARVEAGYFKIGDSNSVLNGFMRNFDWQVLGESNLVQLGAYPELEAVYQSFAGFHLGFLPCAVSGTRSGYPLGIEDAANQPIVPPLAISPLTTAMGPGSGRYAVIMHGTNQESLSQYETNMRAIVAQCIAGGVVPILNTIPACGPCSLQPNTPFNDVVRRVAQDNLIPLIDGRREYDTLPGLGVLGDDIHFNTTGGGVDLTASGLQFGLNRRALLTLQALARAKLARNGVASDPVMPSRKLKTVVHQGA